MNHIFFQKITEHELFTCVVIALIFITSLLVGFSTLTHDPAKIEFINSSYSFLTALFILELSLRFLGLEKKRDFITPWNIFDFVIILLSLLPNFIDSSILVMRLLRIFRILKIFSFIPELNFIIKATFLSLKRCFYVVILIFIIFYIYAALGTSFFSSTHPELWGDIFLSMLSLLQVLTLSGWELIMLDLQSTYPYSWIYFLTFIFITSVVFLNLLVALMVDAISGAKKEKDTTAL